MEEELFATFTTNGSELRSYQVTSVHTGLNPLMIIQAALTILANQFTQHLKSNHA